MPWQVRGRVTARTTQACVLERCQRSDAPGACVCQRSASSPCSSSSSSSLPPDAMRMDLRFAASAASVGAEPKPLRSLSKMVMAALVGASFFFFFFFLPSPLPSPGLLYFFKYSNRAVFLGASGFFSLARSIDLPANEFSSLEILLAAANLDMVRARGRSVLTHALLLRC